VNGIAMGGPAMNVGAPAVALPSRPFVTLPG